MFNENFDPLAELEQLRNDSIRQRNTINVLVQNNATLQDLLVELTNQHESITHQYKHFHRRLSELSREIKLLKLQNQELTNDVDSEN